MKIKCLFGYHECNEIWEEIIDPGTWHFYVCSVCRKFGMWFWTTRDKFVTKEIILKETSKAFILFRCGSHNYLTEVTKGENQTVLSWTSLSSMKVEEIRHLIPKGG